MKIRLHRTLLAGMIGVAIIVAMAFGCSDRLVDSSDSAELRVAIAIDGDASPKLLALVDQYYVIVTNTRTGRTITRPLTLNGAILEGVIDSLPAGVPLTFTVEATTYGVTGEPGVVIYRGRTEAVIAADQATVIHVNLTPVVPLIKYTPRYVLLMPEDSVFSLAVKVFNVDSLYGISFRVTWDDMYLWPDSAVLSPDLPSDSVIFYYNFIDTNAAIVAASVSETRPNRTLVDAHGDVTLGRVYFRRQSITSAPANASVISLTVTSAYKADETQIPFASIYTDECLVDIMPSDQPMAPPGPH
jgi:hypothetical protein